MTTFSYVVFEVLSENVVFKFSKAVIVLRGPIPCVKFVFTLTLAVRGAYALRYPVKLESSIKYSNTFVLFLYCVFNIAFAMFSNVKMNIQTPQIELLNLVFQLTHFKLLYTEYPNRPNRNDYRSNYNLFILPSLFCFRKLSQSSFVPRPTNHTVNATMKAFRSEFAISITAGHRRPPTLSLV